MANQDKKIEPRRLKGFRDFMPDLMELRSKLQGIIRSETQLAGFREIGTPALEYAETLLGQGGEETDKQVYRFEDHGKRSVALRFDLTVPFARFVAEHQGTLTFPFKRLQIGDVWRGENTQKGRFREFCQCDLDIIGVDSVVADLEIISCFYRILASFNLGGFVMRLGHRVLLSSMISKIFNGPLTEELETKTLIALDKLDKIGKENVLKLLCDLPGVSSDKAAHLLEILTSKDAANSTPIDLIKEFLGQDERSQQELARMQTLLSLLESLTKQQVGGQIVLDLSIARGLSYYTGVVFETNLEQLPGFGSICSGGRYNNLAERFTSRSLPGVGGSIGLDRLLAGLEELNKVSVDSKQKVFIAVATDDALETAFNYLQLLRSAKIYCDIGMTLGKLGNQFKHADRLGFPLVIILGTEEVKSSVFSMKNMKTGAEEKLIPSAQLVSKVRSTLT